MFKKTILAVAMSALPILVWGADVQLKVSGGNGSKYNPYLISSAEDMVELANACNTPQGGSTNGTNSAHYSGVYFKVTADIDFTGNQDFKGIAIAPAEYAPGTTWKFQGIFDGQGHKISGLKIDGIVLDASGKAQTSGANKSRNYVGLFGYLGEGASVSNIVLSDDCYISGYQYVGSISGYADSNTSITNCTSMANVDAYDSYAGGIVARVSAATNKYTDISSCYYGGTVRTCNQNVGGIVGQAGHANISITDCVNAGAVIASSFNSIKEDGKQYTAGGIVGALTGKIKGCMNIGSVYASQKNAGGIAGTFSGATNEIRSSVNLGDVKCPTVTDLNTVGVISGTAAGKFFDCYYDAQMWGSRSAAGKTADGINLLSTDGLTSGTPLTGLDGWIFEKGFYPRPAQFDNTLIREAAATYLIFADGEAAGDFHTSATISTAMAGITAEVTDNAEAFTVNGGKVTVADIDRTEQGVVKLTNGSYTLNLPLVAVPTYFKGAGTKEDPYIIDSKKALMGLAELCNGVQFKHYEGEYFVQTADIDMENDPDFKGIAVTGTYVTVANLNTYFCGNYDGGGHKISNLTINGVTLAETGKVDSSVSFATVGLFGALKSGAVISNVVLDSTCSFAGNGNVGSIAGEVNENVTITNCSSEANVIAYSNYAGGIVGHTTCASSSYELNNIVISGCVFGGTVRSNSGNVGGIVGSNEAVVSDCVNGGKISLEQLSEAIALPSSGYVGGIVGTNYGNIIRCVNFGMVISAPQYVGGITGNNANSHKRGSVYQCINAGQIYANKETGSIAGYDNIGTSCNPVLAPNFTDTQYCASPAYGTKNTTANRPHVEATDMLTSQLTDGEVPEGMEGYVCTAGHYPLPENLKDNKLASRILSTYLVLSDSETLLNFTEASLAKAMPLTAEVVTGEEVFHVADGMVTADAVEVTTSGSIAVKNGYYTRVLNLTTLPGILPGKGTAEDPYRIATADDFTALAKSVEESGFDYAGRYFTVTDNLDFTDKVLVPVGNEGAPFNGYFDGGGFTFSNVNNRVPEGEIQYSRALFAYVGINGCVKGIKLDHSDIRGNMSTAGIVANLAGRVENCTVGDSCVIYSVINSLDEKNPYNGDLAGGIVAKADNTAVVINCENGAKVVAEHEVAGIIGGSITTSGAVIKDCVNRGEIGSIGMPYELMGGEGFAGGIAGRFSGTVTNCHNYGHVIVTQMNDAGGIIGYARPGTVVDSCTNYGLIEAAFIKGGGIIGATDPSAKADHPITITNCTNYGSLNIMSAAGGIVGMADNATVIADCANKGYITNRNGAGAGGIVGQASNAVSVKSSYNTGRISANRGSAGIVGEIIANGTEISGCFNAGEIVVESVNEAVRLQCGGGIANTYESASGSVTDCYNVGSVSSQYYSGGIMGMSTNAVIKNCYNLGIVKANQYEGNIAAVTGSTTEIVNCYTSDSLEVFDTDKNVERLTEAELMEAQLGDGYVYAEACLPRLIGLDTIAVAAINSARPLLAEGETADAIKSNIKLGEIEGLEWSVEGPAEVVSGLAELTGEGELTLVASAREYTRSYAFTSIFNGTSAIDFIEASLDELNVVAIYDMSGRKISDAVPGNICVVITRNNNGGLRPFKVLVK